MVSDRSWTRGSFLGFSIDGVVLTFLGGALAGTGWKALHSLDRVLDSNERPDDSLIPKGVGWGTFALGVYAFLPPLSRKRYLVLPSEPTAKKVDDFPEIRDQIVYLAMNIRGIFFGGVTGLLLGAGAGFVLCDVSRPNYLQRVRQTALGAAAFVAGVFALSPAYLKAVLVATYVSVP